MTGQVIKLNSAIIKPHFIPAIHITPLGAPFPNYTPSDVYSLCKLASTFETLFFFLFPSPSDLLSPTPFPLY